MTENDDLFDRFLQEAQPEPPPELAERVLDAVRDADLLRKTYWAEVASAARGALMASAAALLLSAGMLGMALGPQPVTTPTAGAPVPTEAREQIAQITFSDQLEAQALTSLFVLGEEDSE